MRYSEEASVHASIVDTTAIGEHHFVLLHFHMVSGQLFFNKSLMVAALRIAGRENQKAWDLTSVQLEPWTVTLDLR